MIVQTTILAGILEYLDMRLLFTEKNDLYSLVICELVRGTPYSLAIDNEHVRFLLHTPTAYAILDKYEVTKGRKHDKQKKTL